MPHDVLFVCGPPGLSATWAERGQFVSLTNGRNVPWRDFAVVVLGDGAVEAMAPAVARRRAKGDVAKVVLAVDSVPGRHVANWLVHGFDGVVAVDALSSELERRLDGGDGRLRTDSHAEPTLSWLTRALPAGVPPWPSDWTTGGRRPSVAAWAAAAGMSVATLRRRCADARLPTPRRLLAALVAERARAGHADGRSWAGLARDLGYATASGLLRALKRAPATPRQVR